MLENSPSISCHVPSEHSENELSDKRSHIHSQVALNWGRLSVSATFYMHLGGWPLTWAGRGALKNLNFHRIFCNLPNRAGREFCNPPYPRDMKFCDALKYCHPSTRGVWNLWPTLSKGALETTTLPLISSFPGDNDTPPILSISYFVHNKLPPLGCWVAYAARKLHARTILAPRSPSILPLGITQDHFRRKQSLSYSVCMTCGFNSGQNVWVPLWH